MPYLISREFYLFSPQLLNFNGPNSDWSIPKKGKEATLKFLGLRIKNTQLNSGFLLYLVIVRLLWLHVSRSKQREADYEFPVNNVHIGNSVSSKCVCTHACIYMCKPTQAHTQSRGLAQMEDTACTQTWTSQIVWPGSFLSRWSGLKSQSRTHSHLCIMLILQLSTPGLPSSYPWIAVAGTRAMWTPEAAAPL